MDMKKSKIFIWMSGIGLLLLIGSQSCTDLSPKVYDQVQNENFWQTPEQIAAGIGPAYASLRGFPGSALFNLNEVTSDEIIVPTRGNDWYDNGNWEALWKHTYSSTLGPVNDAWNFIFTGVGRCNQIISILGNLPKPPKNLNSIEAELKVLRALYYYWAMDAFGNVPLITDFKTNPNNVTNTDRKDVFAFLEKDIKDNVSLLPSNLDQSTYGRVTKYTAYAILAKMYLNAEVYTGTPHWSDCIAYCDSIISSGKYQLEPDFFANFSPDNSGSHENIFVIPYDWQNLTGFTVDMATLHYQNQETYNLTQTPWNGFCSTADFYNKFDPADQRRQMFLVGQQYGADGTPLKDNQTGLPLVIDPHVPVFSSSAASFRLAGARSVKYQPTMGTDGNMNNDFAIFRLADFMLMKAEAEVRSNTNKADALQLINKIRERAFGDKSHDWTMGDLTLSNILDERAREMAWEGWRRQDVIRFGTFGNARDPAKPNDPDDHLEIFPIPAPQIAANPHLKQNPGY